MPSAIPLAFIAKLALVVAALLALGACNEIGPVATDPCGPWRAIRVSHEDSLTADTARQVLAHNLTGARLCGWAPAVAATRPGVREVLLP